MPAADPSHPRSQASRPGTSGGLGAMHGGARAVAEQDDGGSIFGVDDAAQCLGADEEHVLVAGLQHRRADDELVDEARARGVEVERSASQAERVADERAGVRDQLLGRCGRDDHQVDVGGRQPGALDRLRGRGAAEGGRRLARGGDAPLVNARAFADPGVAGVDVRGEIVVGARACRGPRYPSPRSRAGRLMRRASTRSVGRHGVVRRRARARPSPCR